MIQELLSQAAIENGNQLLKPLTKLINQILAGEVPNYVHEAMFGASLFAFAKEDGGIRPIAVGCFYRRLAGKLAARHATSMLSAEFGPIQLGVGIDGGCESAVHAVREYVQAVAQQPDLADYSLEKLQTGYQ